MTYQLLLYRLMVSPRCLPCKFLGNLLLLLQGTMNSRIPTWLIDIHSVISLTIVAVRIRQWISTWTYHHSNSTTTRQHYIQWHSSPCQTWLCPCIAKSKRRRDFVPRIRFSSQSDSLFRTKESQRPNLYRGQHYDGPRRLYSPSGFWSSLTSDR